MAGRGLCVVACCEGTDHSKFAVGYDDGTLNILATSNLKPLQVLNAHQEAVTAMEWRHKVLLSCDSSGMLIAWETQTFTVTARLNTGNAMINDVASSPDGLQHSAWRQLLRRLFRGA